jgi:hypothetical protein
MSMNRTCPISSRVLSVDIARILGGHLPSHYLILLKNSAFDVGRSSFAFAPARQVGACHAEAFGVGGFDVFSRCKLLAPIFYLPSSIFDQCRSA